MIYRIDVIPIRAERTEACFPPLESVLLRLEDRGRAGGVGRVRHGARPTTAFPCRTCCADWRRCPSPVAMDALAAGLEKFPPQARCALETALLDLRGKRLGVALTDLLGGRRRDRVRSMSLLPRCAARTRDGGCRARVGTGRPDLQAEERHAGGRRRGVCEALRARFGGEARLRLDAGGRWTPDEAVVRMAALRGLELEYVEQPIAPGRLEAMAEIAGSAGVPLAADEDARDAPSSGR